MEFCGKSQFPHSLGRQTPETLRKLCLSINFLHQEIRWSGVILHNETSLTDLFCENILHILVVTYFREKALNIWQNFKCNSVLFLRFTKELEYIFVKIIKFQWTNRVVFICTLTWGTLMRDKNNTTILPLYQKIYI